MEIPDARDIARWAWLTQLGSATGVCDLPRVLTFFHASLPSRGRPAAQDDSRQISLDIPDMSFLPGTGVRQRHTRTAAALGSNCCSCCSAHAQSALIAPQPGMGRLTVAAATPADLRSWDGTIDPSVRGWRARREPLCRRTTVSESRGPPASRHSYSGLGHSGTTAAASSARRAGGVTVSVIAAQLLTGHHRRP